MREKFNFAFRIRDLQRQLQQQCNFFPGLRRIENIVFRFLAIRKKIYIFISASIFLNILFFQNRTKVNTIRRKVFFL